MKTFTQYLQEMSLRSYKTKFSPIPNDEPEGFETNKDGKRKLHSQVTNPGEKNRQIIGRFSKKDRIILSHPATFQSLEQKLSKGRYDFNIIMMEMPVSTDWDYDGIKVPFRDYEEEVENFIKENGIETKGHITFAKNGTSGHVMTSWMILHTIGHAAMKFAGDKKSFLSILESIVLYLSQNSGLSVTYVKSSVRIISVLKNIFMFSSINSPDLRKEELIYDLFAEFLWHGNKIRINPNYQSDEIIVEKIKILESEIKNVLDGCVNHIIYDYYT